MIKKKTKKTPMFLKIMQIIDYSTPEKQKELQELRKKQAEIKQRQRDNKKYSWIYHWKIGNKHK